MNLLNTSSFYILLMNAVHLDKKMALVNADIRQSILDSTRKLVIKDGYNDVSMRKIANQVGCGLGTIYLYFENKDVLFHSLIDEGFEMMFEKIQQAEASQATPESRLRAVCRAYIQFGLSNPEYYEMMYLLHPDRMKRYPKEKFRRARRSFELIAGILQRIADQKGITLKNAKLKSYSIWATLHGAVTILIAKRLDISVDVDEFLDAVVALATQNIN